MSEQATIVAEVREAEKARIAALLARDYDALEGMLDERIAYIHSTAHRDTKASLLETLRSDAYRYLDMETDLQQIEAVGDDAVWAFGQMRAVIEIGAGPAGERHSLLTQLWVRDGETWKLLSFQVTGIPG
ncbi:MAG: nuclear transport factor 2 family protein [Leucobacter sp.]